MPLFKTIIGVAAAVALLAGAELKTGTAPLVTHEWGTFTSVAREDGTAVEWAPLLGPGDLPCFVTRARGIYKSLARGLVRMETPVLYFYPQHDMTLSVHVAFPQGSACPVRVLPYVRRLVNTAQKYPPAATGAKLGSKFQETSRAPAAKGYPSPSSFARRTSWLGVTALAR